MLHSFYREQHLQCRNVHDFCFQTAWGCSVAGVAAAAGLRSSESVKYHFHFANAENIKSQQEILWHRAKPYDTIVTRCHKNSGACSAVSAAGAGGPFAGPLAGPFPGPFPGPFLSAGAVIWIAMTAPSRWVAWRWHASYACLHKIPAQG